MITIDSDEPIPKKHPELELKALREKLKYAYLGKIETMPIIILSDSNIELPAHLGHLLFTLYRRTCVLSLVIQF